MKETKLSFNSRRINPPRGIKALDCILIEPRSMGKLNGGEYSKGEKRRPISIGISATNKDGVKWEEKLLGSKEHYTVIYEVLNFNDSPAVAWLIEKQ